MGSVLHEAVKHYTPDVVIVDEMSDLIRVASLVMAWQRCVRLFAILHKDLRGPERDPFMGPVVGGVERVELVWRERFWESTVCARW